MYKIPASTLFVGKKIIYLPKCHSTNDIATQILNQPSTPDGTVIITDSQEQGRGQRGKTWESEPFRNLTFSIILRPSSLTPADQFVLNMAISLGVKFAIAEFVGDTVSIKWPNDIMVGKEKIAGILIENRWQGARMISCVVGIGINVNQESFSAPMATSIVRATGTTSDLNRVLSIVLARVEEWFVKANEGQTTEVADAYHRHLYLLNKEQVFKSQGNSFQGTICRVRPDGRIVLSIGGKEKDFGAQEVATVQA